MRITAGLYKGRNILCPQWDIRPVMARMREAVFCILYSHFGTLEGLRFLDLFCGSASMSLEAASRGASYIQAVEKDRRKKSIIEENLAIVQVPWDLHMLDVRVYLQKSELHKELGKKTIGTNSAVSTGSLCDAGPNSQPSSQPNFQQAGFDVIYLDPPFAMKDKVALLQGIPATLLAEQSMVMMHLPKREAASLPRKLSELSNGLELLRTKHYGESGLCIYGGG